MSTLNTDHSKILYLPLYNSILFRIVFILRFNNAYLCLCVEGVSYCRAFLIEFYNKIYAQWNPISWYPEAYVDLQTFYCPLQILDSNGSQIQPVDFLIQKGGKGLSRVTVVEGDHGTGKTFLSHFITAKWAYESYKFEENNMKLVFHLDLKITAPNLKWMLSDQIFDVDQNLVEQELWDIIDRNQETCLFILDGYNENINEDVNNLISGVLFPNVHIMILSHLESTALLKGFYQNKFLLTGFIPTESMIFVENYIKLTGRPPGRFVDLLQKISRTHQRLKNKNQYDTGDFNTRLSLPDDSQSELTASINHTVSLEGIQETTEGINNERLSFEEVPENMLIDSNKNNTKNNNRLLNDFQNIKRIISSPAQKIVSDIEMDLQNKLIPLGVYSSIPLYCSFFCAMTDFNLSTSLAAWSVMMETFFSAMKMRLTDREQESRMAVNRSFNILIELSFESVKQNASTISIKNCDRTITLGILKKLSANEDDLVLKYVFSNDLIKNFLAAKYLETCSLDEINNFFQNMLLKQSLYPLIVYYCGLRRNDCENIALKFLFRKITDFNLEVLSRISDSVDYVHSTSGSVDIMKFQLSLDCVAAMNGKNDFALRIGQTLPRNLSIKQITPFLTLQGFTYIIDLNCSNIKELEITFNYSSRQMSDGICNLANYVNQNTSLKVVRLFWDQLELMSLFLCKICEKNQTISTIACYDESDHKYDNLTQNALINIRIACRNMKHVEEFAFRDCVFSTLINIIARNIPENLISLDLSGCRFSLIACKDLVDKIIPSKCLKTLKFEKVHIQSMAFNNFIRSFCDNRTIVELSLNNTKMDNIGFISLIEMLKSNNKLEKLFLLDIVINDQNCSELAQVLRINNILKELHVSENRISFLGQNDLLKNAKHVKIVGITKQNIKPLTEDQESDIFNF